MEQKTSINLDLIRWLASIMVFIYHFMYLGYTGDSDFSAKFFPSLGYLGVAVFFVLSGFVISFVAEEKHHSFEDFLQARLARLYSVYIPALILTFFADIIGRHFSPEIYKNYPNSLEVKTIARFFTSIFFMQENSFFSTRWLSNGPLWSLAFEFWYYIIFSAYFFFKGWSRIFFVTITILFAGYKVMLLSPLWLGGVILYMNRKLIFQIKYYFRKIILISGLGYLLLLTTPWFFYSFIYYWKWGFRYDPIGNHSWFIFYYFSFPAIAAIMVGCMQQGKVTPSKYTRFIQWGAGFSFSLYVYHVPLILLLRSTGIFNTSAPVQATMMAMVVVMLIYGIATITEHRKRAWRNFINFLSFTNSFKIGKS